MQIGPIYIHLFSERSRRWSGPTLKCEGKLLLSEKRSSSECGLESTDDTDSYYFAITLGGARRAGTPQSFAATRTLTVPVTFASFEARGSFTDRDDWPPGGRCHPHPGRSPLKDQGRWCSPQQPSPGGGRGGMQHRMNKSPGKRDPWLPAQLGTYLQSIPIFALFFKFSAEITHIHQLEMCLFSKRIIRCRSCDYRQFGG